MPEVMPNKADIEKLLAYLPLFDKPDRQFVKRWENGEKLGERAFNVPYPVYEEDVKEFFRLAGQPCWNNSNYDPETASRMLENEHAVSTADIESIRTMWTFCVRGERFCDGHWEAVLKSGQIVALLRRLRQIQALSGTA